MYTYHKIWERPKLRKPHDLNIPFCAIAIKTLEAIRLKLPLSPCYAIVLPKLRTQDLGTVQNPGSDMT